MGFVVLMNLIQKNPMILLSDNVGVYLVILLSESGEYSDSGKSTESASVSVEYIDFC